MDERRVVTVLFCDVASSTSMASALDPEDWAEIMRDAFKCIIAPINRYDGTVARLMGDAILAFFGAPHAHEDDPQRAILAGLDIISNIQPLREEIQRDFDLDFNIRVGINTGLVVVGEFGTEQDFEYTAMGDAINLAARMEQTAKPGTVLIAHDTYRLVAPLFEFESLGPVDVKGKDAPILAYRVIGRQSGAERVRGIPGLSPEFVGRQAELTRLANAISEVRLGRGQIICLIGEPGLGKTRLVTELHSSRTDESISWFEDHARSYDSTLPYGLFRNQIRRILGVSASDSAEVAQRKVASLVQSLPAIDTGAATYLERSLLAIAGRAFDSFDETSSPVLDDERRKQQLFQMMTSLWRDSIAREPSVYVVEDLHWADPASVELLSHLVQLTEAQPVLFLFTLRPERESPAWRLKVAAEAEHPHRYAEIVIEPLTVQQSYLVVDNMLPADQLPDDLQQLILDRAEGNPLYVEEIVRALIDQHVLERRDQVDDMRLQLAPYTGAVEISIPTTLQALMNERIDRLEPEVRKTLQLASVIGRSFDHRVLEAIVDQPDHLDQQLRSLQRVGMIHETAWLPHREYAFHHALTWEAAYSMILRRQRRAYHRQVGQAMEQIYADQLGDYTVTLGRHFYEAGDKRAQRYYTGAGDQAFLLVATSEALEHYRRALDVALRMDATPDELIHLHTRIGRTLELRHEFDKAVRIYRELAALATDHGNQPMELAAVMAEAIIRATPTDVHDFEIGKELAERALELARQLGDRRAEARSFWLLLLLYRYLGAAEPFDIDKLLEYGEKSLEIAREQDLKEQRAYTLTDLTSVYWMSGQMDRWHDAIVETRHLWTEMGNIPMLLESVMETTRSSFLRGDFDAVRTGAAEVRQLSESINNYWALTAERWFQMRIQCEQGNVDGALTMAKEAIRMSDQSGFIMARASVLIDLGAIYGIFGDVDRGLQLIDEAEEVYAGSFHPFLESAATIRTRLYAKKAALRSAERSLTEADFVTPGYQLHALLAQGELAFAKQDYEQAIASVDALLPPLQRLDAGILMPDALLLKGLSLRAIGEFDAAQTVLANAALKAEEIGSKRILWAILAAASQLERDRGNVSEMNELGLKGQAVAQFIANHINDEDLRESFMRLPEVSYLLELSA